MTPAETAARIVATYCTTDLIGTRVPDREALVDAIADALQDACNEGLMRARGPRRDAGREGV